MPEAGGMQEEEKRGRGKARGKGNARGRGAAGGRVTHVPGSTSRGVRKKARYAAAAATCPHLSLIVG